MRRLWWILLAALIAAGGGLALGLVLVNRIETGRWKMLDGNDLVRVRDRIAGEAVPSPSRIIYLAREPLNLHPGRDDAPTLRSSVVAAHSAGAVRVPGWKGSKAGWNQVVKCVRDMFKPFAVEVTEKRPTSDEFILVAVGGRPKDIGSKDPRIGGLAPFSTTVIPRAIVFAFAAQNHHQPRPVCETIAMEVAHAYGLDHEYLCKDVMTYLPPCGARRFVDQDAACGEGKRRLCAGGAATQNSYRRLLAVLGPAVVPRAARR